MGTMVTPTVAALGAAVALALVRVARRADARARAAALRRADRRLPGWVHDRLVRALAAAGVPCEPVAALQWWAVAVVAAALVGAILAPALGILGALAALGAGPVGLHAARGRGRRMAAGAVAGALERSASELRAGGTVAGAIEALASARGPLAGDFGKIRDRCALGASLEDALARWPEERDAPGVRAAAGALALAASVGGACADALDALATSLRARLAVIAEARALSAQARLSAVVVGAAPVAYLAWSAVVDPGPLATLVGTFGGRVCLAVAVVLQVLAAVWMRRVLREEAAWS
jgi:tight adherence protein B